MVLSGDKLKLFIDKYFHSWKGDIWKVSYIDFEDTREYLINEHYIFVLKNEELD